MRSFIAIALAFFFGMLFGASLRIKDDYRNAYTHGYHDGVNSCTNKLDQFLEDDEDE